jgi:hypothetical protein
MVPGGVTVPRRKRHGPTPPPGLPYRLGGRVAGPCFRPADPADAPAWGAAACPPSGRPRCRFSAGLTPLAGTAPPSSRRPHCGPSPGSRVRRSWPSPGCPHCRPRWSRASAGLASSLAGPNVLPGLARDSGASVSAGSAAGPTTSPSHRIAARATGPPPHQATASPPGPPAHHLPAPPHRRSPAGPHRRPPAPLARRPPAQHRPAAHPRHRPDGRPPVSSPLERSVPDVVPHGAGPRVPVGTRTSGRHGIASGHGECAG